MSDLHHSNHSPDVLGELVTELLACGAVISQMISGMLEFEASGRSAPDAPPIPEVAHTLIRSVLDSVGRGYSKRDIRVAAKIVDEVTTAICEEIYVVNPEMLDDPEAFEDSAMLGDPEMN